MGSIWFVKLGLYSMVFTFFYSLLFSIIDFGQRIYNSAILVKYIVNFCFQYSVEKTFLLQIITFY